MKKAIDIVILPPEEITEISIYLSNNLLRKRDKIYLNKEDRLPHISLCMGVLDTKDENSLFEFVSQLQKKHLPLDLEISKIKNQDSSASYLIVNKTKNLQVLHEEIIDNFDKLLNTEVKSEYVKEDIIKPTTLEWIRNYKIKASYKNFDPHITIGHGEIKKIDLPVKFTAEILAVCHLGNSCTCREILFKAD